MAIKTLGKICFSLLVVASIIVSIFYIYFKYFDSSVTIGINNINDQIGLDIKSDNELSENEKAEYEERWLIHANYYSNDKENGIKLQEIQYNYFSDYTLSSDSYWSTGMQFLGDFHTYATNVANEKEANKAVVNDFYYYDTTDGISWMGFKGPAGGIGNVLNRDAYMIIKIDNKPYRLKLTGKYNVYDKFLFWDVKTQTVYFDYGDVFDCIMSAIKSNSRGYGDYYIKIDLSQYFSVEKYDEENKKFVKTNADIVKNYARIKFHYDENGAVNSAQSIFGIIACDPKYDNNREQIDTEYWQERVIYNLTDDDLDYRYSEAYNGYLVGLNIDQITLFKKMPRTIVNIIINLDSTYLQNYNIIGLDYNAFENLQINKLSVLSNKSIEIKLLDKCLYNTSLSIIERTSNVALTISENAVNSEYVEVIL